MKHWILIGFTSLSWAISAQVQLIVDPRTDQEVAKRASKQMPGYRIQIGFDSDKEFIDKTRAAFISQFPKIDTYVRFEAPNFNLMVGDFRTQLDAERFKNQLIGKFPIAIIHKEMINLPRVD
ncbi:MAG: hypothetical protein RLZZ301_1026 [Bacteroidota bacterium]|jgi:hypothetical protein